MKEAIIETGGIQVVNRVNVDEAFTGNTTSSTKVRRAKPVALSPTEQTIADFFTSNGIDISNLEQLERISNYRGIAKSTNSNPQSVSNALKKLKQLAEQKQQQEGEQANAT